jgi:DNA-binding CsgD family transcriptional regulator
MWEKPDSALTVLMEYEGDMEGFNGHYAQLLAAELLFKNDYKQSNRTELLKAVHYFDSLVDLRGADARGASLPFLDARAHYINGVGFYEQDSLIEACGEYLNALRIMESHFAEGEMVGHKARFMALTYNRLGDLFSKQFMQEPAIYCYKQALAYNRIAPTSPYGSSNILYRIGKQFDKLKVADSAAYYYEMAMELLPDRNNMVYRDIVSSRALSEIAFYGDAITALDSLKSMTAQAENETERLNRYRTIGSVYFSFEQYDSAKFYLMPVLEKDPNGAMLTAKYLKDIALKEGDTVKANKYALILANEGASAAESQAQVSKLNDIFQSYLQEKQEAASLRERRKMVRLTLMVLLPLLVVIGLVVAIVTRRSHKKRLAAQEAEAQRRLDEASQRLSEASLQLTEASQRHDETERKLQTKVEQAILHTKELLQQRAMSLYYGKEKDKLQRILNEFATAYPQASERLMATPNLKEQERNIIVLSFLHFRAKEIAELLGLSENTVLQYRSNIKKKMGSDPVSDLIG